MTVRTWYRVQRRALWARDAAYAEALDRYVTLLLDRSVPDAAEALNFTLRSLVSPQETVQLYEFYRCRRALEAQKDLTLQALREILWRERCD